MPRRSGSTPWAPPPKCLAAQDPCHGRRSGVARRHSNGPPRCRRHLHAGLHVRPSYRKLSSLRRKFPDIPLLALTATAVPKVQKM